MRTPLLTVDIVIRTPEGIVLIRRDNPPFKGFYALPGGFVEVGERVEEAAVREAREETGLTVRLERLVGVYSDPDRDPRGHVVSICYAATASGIPRAGSDAKDAGVFSPDELPPLAFDHGRMIADSIERDRKTRSIDPGRS